MQRAYVGLAGDGPDPDLAVVAAQLGRFLALTADTQKGLHCWRRPSNSPSTWSCPRSTPRR